MFHSFLNELLFLFTPILTSSILERRLVAKVATVKTNMEKKKTGKEYSFQKEINVKNNGYSIKCTEVSRVTIILVALSGVFRGSCPTKKWHYIINNIQIIKKLETRDNFIHDVSQKFLRKTLAQIPSV